MIMGPSAREVSLGGGRAIGSRSRERKASTSPTARTLSPGLASVEGTTVPRAPVRPGDGDVLRIPPRTTGPPSFERVYLARRETGQQRKGLDDPCMRPSAQESGVVMFDHRGAGFERGLYAATHRPAGPGRHPARLKRTAAMSHLRPARNSLIRWWNSAAGGRCSDVMISSTSRIRPLLVRSTP